MCPLISKKRSDPPQKFDEPDETDKDYDPDYLYEKEVIKPPFCNPGRNNRRPIFIPRSWARIGYWLGFTRGGGFADEADRSDGPGSCGR